MKVLEILVSVGVNCMKWIQDKQLLAAYNQAITCNLEKEFIYILKREMERRKKLKSEVNDDKQK